MKFLSNVNFPENFSTTEFASFSIRDRLSPGRRSYRSSVGNKFWKADEPGIRCFQFPRRSGRSRRSKSREQPRWNALSELIFFLRSRGHTSHRPRFLSSISAPWKSVFKVDPGVAGVVENPTVPHLNFSEQLARKQTRQSAPRPCSRFEKIGKGKWGNSCGLVKTNRFDYLASGMRIDNDIQKVCHPARWIFDRNPCNFAAFAFICLEPKHKGFYDALNSDGKIQVFLCLSIPCDQQGAKEILKTARLSVTADILIPLTPT